ncbi:SAM-dependent methyltransferase [Geomonas limicola]|uniref:SAM-dependent methyltransferase n=1 Tax=Geomonas limicola TaxID=2740186 RepID=A0A6V8NDY1_9BACT|nr:class I SAM-dependent methyltransferase [Geomonas limicola]GFO70845.1 SAM-dependent methyltransferase [Geomonas limicola]
MIQDPKNQFIAAILSHTEIHGKEILEIGCGKGRITGDLARHARRVVAIDPDAAALEQARQANAAANIEYLPMSGSVPAFPAASFNLVFYTLSLHHVPPQEMQASLLGAAHLLRDGGNIVVIEPGYQGSFIEAKLRFAAGSGDERPAQDAAIRAMHALPGWFPEETVLFRTEVLFRDLEDFLINMLPKAHQAPGFDRKAVRAFLEEHRTTEGILLDAERRLNLLRPLPSLF